MTFPEALPHGSFQEIFDNVFFLTGSVEMQDGVFKFSRNMTVVREGKELTLINTVRLNEEGLSALDALGEVKHIVKIGSYHNMDDAFYMDRYSPKLWALDGMTLPDGCEDDVLRLEDGSLPIQGAKLFIFASKLPEALLLLPWSGGILIACDSLQNICQADEFFNEEAAQKMKEWGFIQPANIGPGWLREAKPVAEDFRKVQELPFQHLLSGHGEPLLHTAKEEFSKTFEERFPS